MSLRKLCWAAVAWGVCAGAVSAEPMRTVFTKENKFPEALRGELSLAGGGSSYDGDRVLGDVSKYYVAPGARFGLTDRVAVLADVPYAGYSSDLNDADGLGDISLGLDFLFFEDIFEYAWIIPHVAALLPTGDEDEGLGEGQGQGVFGVSIGTTTMDVLHWAADVTYTSNGSSSEEDEDLVTGALSLVWDLDTRSSLLGEVQVRDDALDPEDSYALRGHIGMAYKINKHFTLMGYGGGASGLAEDLYGMGRLVYAF